MVYIDRDGRVLERRPWSVARVLEICTSIWFVTVTFFRTLMAPFMNNDNPRSNTRPSRWGTGGGGGGPGGGGGGGRGGGNGGGFNQGLRPNRRIGRVVNTSMDCNIPGGG
ncbi:glycine-rich selenoprotein-like [Bactrocera neohumeralis]|uniref:glycine-rich selenoprotein-like n=1 Tax=Bactrocera tryoni TaxID=59916 RepID=UPI001A9A01B6|nr:glycine-rich selenoprotein-like [Bactrocera tryoni]XP_050329153.1 glycine-rich selenoprotein-like [Bactrocera neohumeralis]